MCALCVIESNVCRLALVSMRHLAELVSVDLNPIKRMLTDYLLKKAKMGQFKSKKIVCFKLLSITFCAGEAKASRFDVLGCVVSAAVGTL